jgi:tetratricopeptide (TPR) repeat protein
MRNKVVPTLDERLSAINQLIVKNQLTSAIAEAQRLVQTPQARLPALAMLALASALAEQEAQAREALSHFSSPEDAPRTELLLAVGSAWFKLGEPVEAITYLSAAALRSPEQPLVQARLGACLLATGRIDEAVPHLEKAVVLLPQSGGAWLNLARVRLAQGHANKALEALERAQPLPDKEPDIYRMTRAEVLMRLGRRTESVDQLRQAITSEQDGAAESLVNLLCSLGEHDDAWQVLREELEKKPAAVPLLELAAELAQVRGRFGEADHYLDRALKLEPENSALWHRRAMMASRRLGADQGRVAADQALALTRDKAGLPFALALAAHAHVLIEENQHAQAEAAYREALAIAPKCAPALSGLGQLLMQLGRVDEAIKSYEQLRAVAPMQGWSQLIQAREVPDDPQVLEQMARAAHRASMEGPVRTHMLFNLAAAWEKKKDNDKAWAFAIEANEATKEKIGYRPEVHRQRIEREMARFSKAFMHHRAGWGDTSSLPVFVLGMPRSGTTLVEQILGSHSQVFGAGELSLVPELIQKLNAWETRLGSRREYPECIDDMSQDESARFAKKHLAELQAYAPEAQRIVDKLPHNFEHIGLIKLMFPNAKILHMKREPRDVAMSNYFTDYSAKFGGMGFAYDLTWIGEQLVDQDRLMAHWHSVFPGQILEVDYDALVEDVEGWARQIIGHLSLPWEDGVLSFQSLERAVKTASVWQVRQPVYTTSKAKWKRYVQHLGVLEAALAEVPPNPVPSPLPKIEPALFLRGMALLQSGQPSEAQQAFKSLLSARSAHAAAHHFLGAALYQMKQYDEARKEMKRSIELLGNQHQWLENLAKVEDALGNTDEAQNIRARLVRGKTGAPSRRPDQANPVTVASLN